MQLTAQPVPISLFKIIAEVYTEPDVPPAAELEDRLQLYHATVKTARLYANCKDLVHLTPLTTAHEAELADGVYLLFAPFADNSRPLYMRRQRDHWLRVELIQDNLPRVCPNSFPSLASYQSEQIYHLAVLPQAIKMGLPAYGSCRVEGEVGQRDAVWKIRADGETAWQPITTALPFAHVEARNGQAVFIVQRHGREFSACMGRVRSTPDGKSLVHPVNGGGTTVDGMIFRQFVNSQQHHGCLQLSWFDLDDGPPQFEPIFTPLASPRT